MIKQQFTDEKILEIASLTDQSLSKEELERVKTWYDKGISDTLLYNNSEDILIDIISRVKTEGAMRFNDGKLEWSLVDFKSLEPMVRVLEFGAKKYSRDNWKRGLETTKIVESTLRHLFAFLDGETNDKESNLPHLGHAMCNLMFLQYMMDNKPEFDDRIKIKEDE